MLSASQMKTVSLFLLLEQSKIDIQWISKSKFDNKTTLSLYQTQTSRSLIIVKWPVAYWFQPWNRNTQWLGLMDLTRKRSVKHTTVETDDASKHSRCQHPWGKVGKLLLALARDHTRSYHAFRDKHRQILQTERHTITSVTQCLHHDWHNTKHFTIQQYNTELLQRQSVAVADSAVIAPHTDVAQCFVGPSLWTQC